MKSLPRGLIIGICIGLVIGLLLAVVILFLLRYRRGRSSNIRSTSSRRNSTVPFRVNGVDVSTVLSDSTAELESPKPYEMNRKSIWPNRKQKENLISMSGIPKYLYRDLQKATSNFTAVLGQGAYGTVYKAVLSTGQTVAVKALSTKSNQGEKEFLTEVFLLGKLHHKNLVNLVGYCCEKGRNMLIFVYMPNGNLASHLYGETHETLIWDLRVPIALDVAKGVEYLHDGVVPPVLHRDIKSSNILLDQAMIARVADFGLSREEVVNSQASSIRGTYGYLDPEYLSAKTYTKKSDVYSFGVVLFDLITGRNPQQGLLEYVDLAVINVEGRTGWEEIADPRLEGLYNVQELNDMATLAYKCINRKPRRRPSMRDVVQTLCRILTSRDKKRHHRRNSSITTLDEDYAESEISDLHIVTPNSNGEDMNRIPCFPNLPEVQEV